jgi:hypothetical protein
MSVDCHQTIWHYIPEDSSSEEVKSVERQRAEGHYAQEEKMNERRISRRMRWMKKIR